MDRWRLRLAKDVAVSFQRFAWPSGGVISMAPPSLGALPVGTLAATGMALLPVAPGEALWIGLDTMDARSDASLAVAVQLLDGRVLDVNSGAPWNERNAAHVSLLHHLRIDGIARADNTFDVIGRAPGAAGGSCAQLTFHVSDSGDATGAVDPSKGFTVALVDYVDFRQRTGMAEPAPLDPDAGYRGYRLP